MAEDFSSIVSSLNNQIKGLAENYKGVRDQKVTELKSGSSSTAAGSSTGLKGTVGDNAQNLEADVRWVQQRLVAHGIQVSTDGKMGPKTIAAIKQFQQSKSIGPDGVISPGKGTYKALAAAPSGGANTSGNTSETPSTGGNASSGVLGNLQASGAGAATAKQDKLDGKGLTGKQISETMAKSDAQRVNTYRDLFVKVGKEQGVPPAVLAAIASRETRGRQIMNGDGGNGIGIIQVDVRHHPEKVAKIRAKQGAAQVEESIRQGAIIFKEALAAVKKKFPDWSEAQQLKGAMAAYNAGIGNVRTFENMDKGTTGDDYSGDVWTRAQYFANSEGYATEGEGENNSAAPSDSSSSSSSSETPAKTETAPPAKTEATPAADSSTSGLKGSVGDKGENLEADVRWVQQRLVAHGYQVSTDGKIGPKTIAAIKQFQQAKLGSADGLISPGKGTYKALAAAPSAAAPAAPAASSAAATDTSAAAGGKDFSHANAKSVKLSYGERAVRLNARAENLLKSILASVGMNGATVTSTIRTYHDQARITKTQTLPNKGEGTVRTWYGQQVLDATKRLSVDELAKWWETYDKNRGKVSSKHLSNQALDVVPSGDRVKFAAKVAELVGKSGSGVRRIIKKGEMNEPVDHVEFTFKVTG